ncbi:MAG: phospho-sugar mutase [Cyclobacteriaceae bacterium]|jgi:phosphoglucomutase|nr:phospho-sugar mutase [Cytophagales bacterium]MCZ8327628.1 phospho-sugar mutase [Cyclobacteriaceae bacterium]
MVSEAVRERVNQWLTSKVIDDESKNQIQTWLTTNDDKTITDFFYKELEFGTGGLRGVMGVGSNGVNKYTVGKATQGLANYLRKSITGKTIRVVVAHDSRNNSKSLAYLTASVFSANGIRVYLFNDLRPTPLLSFALRTLQCDSGVVITASHNPKEYNGYKAYWNDGAQVVPPHDKNIIEEVNAITSFEEILFEANPDLITPVPAEVEEKYYEIVTSLIPNRATILANHTLPIAYSSLHGAGITMVPTCLQKIGFTNVHVVNEQALPDGNFPTVQSPNPEERSAMEFVIRKGIDTGADLVMATDPDTDRVGIGIRNSNGQFELLNGNQAFSLLMYFILKNQTNTKDAYIAKTIVTTELIDAIATALNVTCYNTLTGFKYIAEIMNAKEGKERFIAAGEESYGYMVGDFVRDKDAVSACAFFAAMAADAKAQGKTLKDELIDMYVKFGFYKESLITLTKKGQEGEIAIKAMMEKFRASAPSEMNGSKVVRALDYKKSEEKDMSNGQVKKLAFPPSDVLQYYLADGTKISVRPSGTEPKIKFYISVHTHLPNAAAYNETNLSLEEKLKSFERFLLAL